MHTPPPQHQRTAVASAGQRRQLFLRAARACAPAAVAAMAAAPGAAAAPAHAYPPRVQAVLDHLARHPMTVTSQAMQYDAQPTTPLPECVQGLTPADVVPPRGRQQQQRQKQQDGGGDGGGGSAEAAAADGQPDMAHVVAALLYAAVGGLDEAHNCVTPLSWGSWTPYGGKPVPGSPAAAEAAYVHAIVHRQEGHCIGEFGSGFSNANYWYRAAGDHPIFPGLLKAARALAAGKPRCEAHVARHGERWRPDTFVALLDEVAGSGDAELRCFAEGIMAAELQQLLRWCYDRM